VGQAVAGAGDPRFEAAYRALRNDPSVQFDLVPVQPEPKLPDWIHTLGQWVADLLRPVGRLLAWIGRLMPDAPYARIALWSMLVLLVAAIGWAMLDRWRFGIRRLPIRRRPVGETSVEDVWIPDSAPARAWLREADSLAERGAYAEAVHYLLWRSIEDIERRRPGLMRPALTSRDIATSGGIPSQARTIFAGIAGVVERSLFGGRPVDAEDWARCREDYANFIRGKVWSA
jgi:hypothetical protein